MAQRSRSKTTKLLLSALVLALLWAAPRVREHLAAFLDTGSGSSTTTATAPADRGAAAQGEEPHGTGQEGAETIRAAFRAQRSGFMVTCSAVVAKSLPDDREGSRHQRFIAEM